MNCDGDLVKLKEQNPWIYDINSQSLICSIGHLVRAFGNFFAKRCGYPKFKCKATTTKSFEVPQHFQIDFKKSKIKIPKFSRKNELKVKISRRVNSLGFDFGVKHFLTLSGGRKIDSQSISKTHQPNQQKHKENQARSKKEARTEKNKESKQQKSTSISQTRETISFISSQVVQSKKANLTRFEPSSQICSSCGYQQKMPLDVRTYECPECRLKIDRDVNAAINIRNFSLRNIFKKKNTDGTSRINACRDGSTGMHGENCACETAVEEARKSENCRKCKEEA